MKPKLLLFSRLQGHSDADGNLEVLGLKYLILPFSLLGAGLCLAFLIFLAERKIKKSE